MKPLYIFWGKVVGGKKRGKTLGYPTANIAFHKDIPEGIYAAEVVIRQPLSKKTSPRPSPKRRGIIYFAATFIGAAKTFEESEKKAESFLLDFHGNLYGKWITVMLYKKLRNNKKFHSEKELITQMEQDILATKKYFQKG